MKVSVAVLVVLIAGCCSKIPKTTEGIGGSYMMTVDGGPSEYLIFKPLSGPAQLNRYVLQSGTEIVETGQYEVCPNQSILLRFPDQPGATTLCNKLTTDCSLIQLSASEDPACNVNTIAACGESRPAVPNDLVGTFNQNDRVPDASAID